jgi:hypothetical protein
MRVWLVLSFASIAACGEVTNPSPIDSTAHGGAATSSGGEVARGGQPSTNPSGSTGGTAILESSGGATIVTSGGFATGGLSGGTSNGRPPHAARPCESPFPRGEGIVGCLDGSSRRLEPGECEVRLPRAEAGNVCDKGDECCLDTDCVERPLGFCSGGACRYGCVSDADCAGGVCACGDWVGVCVAASCHGAVDCPPDFPCSAGSLNEGFACQTPTDECLTARDCGLGPVWCSSGPEGRTCFLGPG